MWGDHAVVAATERNSVRAAPAPVEGGTGVKGKGYQCRAVASCYLASHVSHKTSCQAPIASNRQLPHSPTPVVSLSPPTEMSTGGRMAAQAARACKRREWWGGPGGRSQPEG